MIGRPDPGIERGADGLTTEELRSSRDCWWDDPFTRVLLDVIPEAARSLLEIGCGLARVAHAVLPHRPELHYLGVDLDRRRLAEAGSGLAATRYGRRAALLQAAGERLPIDDGAADAVLTAMTLQHVRDVDAVLDEARRVLAPGGALVAVEPDNLGQRYYFDGVLDEVTAAFRALAEDRRAARAPADLAIGPRVPALLRRAGFSEISLRVHSVQDVGYRPAGEIAAGLRNMADTLAATAAAACDERTRACQSAVDRWLDAVGADAAGQFATIVPVFVTRARRG